MAKKVKYDNGTKTRVALYLTILSEQDLALIDKSVLKQGLSMSCCCDPHLHFGLNTFKAFLFDTDAILAMVNVMRDIYEQCPTSSAYMQCIEGELVIATTEKNPPINPQ